MTITKARREAVRTILANSNVWDADTMHISNEGMVTACKDSNKTMRPHDSTRYLVSYLDNMVTADGKIREGF